MTRRFIRLDGLVGALDRANVDTDAILPKQFMKSVRRTGFGEHAFDEWRYLDRGEPGQDCSRRPLNPNFTLNQPRYKGASILLTRRNFGCGSSREHAPWALYDMGIRALIAPNFADIFYGNCFKNGMLPVCLPESVVEELFLDVTSTPGYRLTLDLITQTVTTPTGKYWHFDVDSERRHRLINGLDDIAETMAFSDEIRAYEKERQQKEPWLFA